MLVQLLTILCLVTGAFALFKEFVENNCAGFAACTTGTYSCYHCTNNFFDIAAISVSVPAFQYYTFGYKETNSGCRGASSVTIYNQCKICIDCSWSNTNYIGRLDTCRGCSRKRSIDEMATTMMDSEGNGIRHMTPEEVVDFTTGKEAIPHNEMMVRFEDDEGNYIVFYNSEATERIAEGDLIPDASHNQRTM